MEKINDNNINVLFVKLDYFKLQYENNLLKKNCIKQELLELIFKWSLETVKQFSKNLIENCQNFYISNNSHYESNLQQKILKIIKIFNKNKLEKVDIFELIAILPLIVEPNLKNAILASMNLFNFENQDNYINAEEFGFYIDSLFRSFGNVLIIEEKIFEEFSKDIITLEKDEIDNEVYKIFEKNDEDTEINIEKVFEYVNNIK
jgi:hypothetical protein